MSEWTIEAYHETSVTSYVYKIRPKMRGPFDGCWRVLTETKRAPPIPAGPHWGIVLGVRLPKMPRATACSIGTDWCPRTNSLKEGRTLCTVQTIGKHIPLLLLIQTYWGKFRQYISARSNLSNRPNHGDYKYSLANIANFSSGQGLSLGEILHRQFLYWPFLLISVLSF